ncbi:MAG: DUF1697 domain-containing protein [Solirubrobacteraceae bacterium]
MTTQIVLLRGINIGPNNRISMAPLREALTKLGYGDVRTYVQSGNIVLDTQQTSEELAERFTHLLESQFDLRVPVVSRTASELAAVVKLNPLGDVATEPKRYQVSFLSGEPDPEVVERMRGLVAEGEAFAAHGRELYGWHPAGIARSKLWGGLADKKLGVIATARNWITVSTLHEMAS